MGDNQINCVYKKRGLILMSNIIDMTSRLAQSKHERFMKNFDEKYKHRLTEVEIELLFDHEDEGEKFDTILGLAILRIEFEDICSGPEFHYEK